MHAQADTLSAGSVRVIFAPHDRELASRVLAAAREPLPLPGLPRATLPPTEIVLAPTPEVWDSVTGGRAPEWAGGVAFPALGRIVLPVFPSAGTRREDLAVTLRHELVHLVLHANLPGEIPRWFNEGYAEWVSGGWDAASGWQLRLAILLGRAPPLDSLSLEWPAGSERARLAYLLSATAVRHLAERGGERGFAALLAAWREQGSLDEAIRTVYGMTLGQFEAEWRRSVRSRYGWLLAFSQVTVFWLGVTVLFLLLGTGRRLRDRRRLEEMRAEERMLPPPDPFGVDEDWRAE